MPNLSPHPGQPYSPNRLGSKHRHSATAVFHIPAHRVAGDKPADVRVVVPGLQVVEGGLGVIDIGCVAYRLALHGSGLAGKGRLAPGIVAVSGHVSTGTGYDPYHITPVVGNVIITGIGGVVGKAHRGVAVPGYGPDGAAGGVGYPYQVGAVIVIVKRVCPHGLGFAQTVGVIGIACNKGVAKVPDLGKSALVIPRIFIFVILGQISCIVIGKC